MKKPRLKTVSAMSVDANIAEPVDAQSHALAAKIVNSIKLRGEEALLEYAERFSDLPTNGQLVWNPKDMEAARGKIRKSDLALLERTAERIRRFAREQLGSISDLLVPIPGGVAGQDVVPIETAGCYAPAGRFPLPSSLLMTAVTANAAGVRSVWVASPNPSPIILAAASCAEVDGLLSAGGAHAIAAMAYGTGRVPACDIIVGPGNRFVTAAKQIVFGKVGIDMLAGPSELTVLADTHASPSTIAADLLAQAEHDPDARPILVSLDAKLVDAVNDAIEIQLESLATRETAVSGLENGFAVVARDLDEATSICDEIAPEHLAIFCENPREVAAKCKHYGAVFLGEGSAEVLGDYGAGPNHTLPTGGTARYTGGLSVFNFLRIRTWIQITDGVKSKSLFEDAAQLARLEGLEGHAMSAKQRMR